VFVKKSPGEGNNTVENRPNSDGAAVWDVFVSIASVVKVGASGEADCESS